MKKKTKKIILISLGTLVLVVGILALIYLDMIIIFLGNKNLEGKQGNIPRVESNIQIPIEKGENDWPCWRGIKGDGRSGVTGIVTDWSKGLKKEWQVDYLCSDQGTATWSAPNIQGKHLFVCGRDEENDLVFCLNAETGELIWEESFQSEKVSIHGAGARATPYLDGDYIFTFNRGGDLICREISDGRMVWHRNVDKEGGKPPRWGHSTSPLVYNALVIVDAGGTAGTIAFEKDTGAIKWKTGQGFSGYAALSKMRIDDKDMIVSFHEDGLSAIDPEDGNRTWFVPWKHSTPVNAATPVVSGNRVFITSIGIGCELLEVSSTQAKVLWKNKNIESHHSDPIIMDGYIYGYSGLSGQNRGTFKCLDLKTGGEMWSTKIMGWGTFVYVDSYLLCLDIKGNLFLMKPDPKEFIKITELKNVFGKIRGPVWTVPVIANDRLYVRYKQQLICFNLKEAL